MKKILLIIILFGLNSCKQKEISGVWMSYNDKLIYKDSSYTGNISGFIIDFDNNKIGPILSDSLISFNLDFKSKQIKIDNDTIDFKLNENKQVEIELYENTLSIFHLLDLDLKIRLSKKEIENFLISNSFEHLNGYLKIDFKDKPYWLDDKGYLKTVESNFLKNETAFGYWFVGEIRNNYFLFFNLIDSEERNIYQILEIKENGLKLKPISEIDYLNGVTELKTSL